MAKVIIRPLKLADVSAAVEVERAAWSPPWPQEYIFDERHLVSQIEVFQEGLLGAFIDGRIAGFVTSEIVDSELVESVDTWDQMTDCGYIRRTHDPRGDTMYGVNLSVHPRAPKSIAEQLLFAGGRLAIKKSLKRIVLGGRLPRYYRYADEMTAEEYIAASRSRTGKPLDPELYMYIKAGLKVIRVLPDYIPDPESMNYGVLLEWKNPFYPITRWCKALALLLSYLVQFAPGVPL